MEFQSPHSGHLPTHLGLAAPHFWQIKAVLGFFRVLIITLLEIIKAFRMPGILKLSYLRKHPARRDSLLWIPAGVHPASRGGNDMNNS